MRTESAALLDINVLIALAWPNHVHHQPARDWFAAHHREGWATTPVTELGFVRISSNKAVLRPATTPGKATELLGRLTEIAGHTFWPDAVRLVTGSWVAGDDVGIQSHRDVTDAHLLALARSHRGRLVTFDTHLSRLAGPGEADVVDPIRLS